MVQRTFEDWVGDLLREACPGDGLSLDVGCGTGRSARYFNNTVVGIDIDRSVRPAVAGTADVLPFKDGRFSFAASFQSYLFVQDVDGAFAELNRVLEQGGTAIISINKWYYLKRERRTHDGTVHVLSHGAWIRAFERQGFEHLLVRVPPRYMGPLAPVLNWASRHFGPYNIYKIRKVQHVGKGRSGT
jgi:SAM-dependent methyltransferase